MQNCKTITTEGVKIYLNPKEGDDVNYVNFDSLHRKIFKENLKEGQNILDLGAHVGYYTLIGAKIVGRKGKVYSFEPFPENSELISKSARENGLENIIVKQQAVNDVTEKGELYVWPESSRYNRTYKVNPRQLNSIEISKVKIDDFLDDYPRIDFIRIDIAGSEGRAIEGMKRLLKRDSPKIIMEFSPKRIKMSGYDPAKTLEVLKDNKYEFWQIKWKGLFKGLKELRNVDDLLKNDKTKDLFLTKRK